MTLKGLAQSERDVRWHKKHEKKLLKAKRRHKRSYNFIAKSQLLRAEEQFKKARERVKQMSLLLRLLKRLRLWFISLKPVVWIRKFLHWYHERQYRG